MGGIFGGAGVTPALDNLASVAINTSLLSDTDVTDDLGSAAKQWRKVYTPAIAFPATQVADGGANVLDDYEEGTWTATFTCGTSGTITLEEYSMAYTKVGRKVTLTGTPYVGSVSSPVGTLTLGGLPFACAAGIQGSAYTAASVYPDGMETTATTMIIGRLNAGSSNIILSHFATGTAAAMAADMKAASQICINITYFVA